MAFGEVRELGVPGWEYRVDEQGDVDAQDTRSRGGILTISSPRGVYVLTRGETPVPMAALEAVVRLRRERP